MSELVQLHCHSQYSLMDGLCSPAELMGAAKDLGQTAISITDHGTLSGHREMQKAAREMGLKPILGVEAYISETDRFDRRAVKDRDDNTQVFNHIILLAKDQAGLKNLQKLSEIAWTEGFYRKPRIDMEVLGEYGDGLIVLSGCMNGLIAKAVEKENITAARTTTSWFKSRFGDDFYMEIQPHNPPELNYALLDLADDFGVKPVVTLDCHYARPEQRQTEEALLILSTSPTKDRDAEFSRSRKMEMMERFNYLYPDRPISFEEIDVFIKSRGDVRTAMLEQGIEREDIYDNTLNIADQIGEYEYHENLKLLPEPKVDPVDRLVTLCNQGLKRRGHADDEKYQKRLKMEIDIISKKDFAPYFLVVSDMITWAKKNDILVGPGRGSAAGSLVCYTLGITEVDPIKYDLLFARFINEERNDFPDIDTDFEDRRRGEVKEYLRRKFKNVASISTYSYFSDKGVVRDASRVFGVPLGEVNKVLKGVETFEDFERASSTSEFRMEYPEVLDLARSLRGRIRGNGMHAAGVVVSRIPISEIAPIETRTDPNDKVSGRIPVIAYDMEQAADIGLIKLDVLGLKTLSVIDDTLEQIKARHGKDIDLYSLDLEDEKVYADLSAGHTKGVFQAEQAPYTALIQKMGLDSFEDLAASNALVRPGAMNTVGASYIARKRGKELVKHIHPIMKDFTENTYGVIIYQEQVMQACVELAGMSWSDADKIRKIIGKKKDVHEFDAYRDQFIRGASKNIHEDQAAKLWHDFEAHAGYSFNRSHAVAYSLISYWTAWLKYYYPLEFMYALLKNEGDKKMRTQYLIEAKRLGIKILLPHINYSDTDFSIEGDAIRFGLGDVKGLTAAKSAAYIVQARPFKTYTDFVAWAGEKGSGINSRMIESLNAIGAAAFDDNPLRGNEQDNLYEYLSIPKFDMSMVPEYVSSQVDRIEDFEEVGCFIFLAMAESIKRGKGWSRIQFIDESGNAGLFHSEESPIETGQMYLVLAADNRVARYIPVTDIKDREDDPLLKYMRSDELGIPHDAKAVLSFQSQKTKAGKMMAHIVLSNKQKKLTKIIAFTKMYPRALALMRPGAVVKTKLGKLEDDTLFVREVERG